MTRGRTNERSWTFILVGIALLLTLISVIRTGPAKPPAPPPIPQLTPAMVPLITGEESVPRMFNKAGCPVCHTIPGIQGAEGRVGPKLVLGTNGPKRLADPTYHGAAKTVREYIIESILKPGAYVVPGYPAGAMPKWYGEKISAGALESIANYLESQKED
ncbi:MAG TPA: hypothetical protein VFA38_02355 [Nitrospirales bacterium]|nr:hypothetical protein [Nitrospirales bacterium]